MNTIRLVFLTIVSIYLGQFAWAQNQNGAEATSAGEAAVSVEGQPSEFAAVQSEVRGKLKEIFQEDFGESSWGRLFASFVIILLTYVARKIVGYLFENWLHRIAAKTSWEFDDKMVPAMRAPVGWMVFVIGLFIALTILKNIYKIERILGIGDN